MLNSLLKTLPFENIFQMKIFVLQSTRGVIQKNFQNSYLQNHPLFPIGLEFISNGFRIKKMFNNVIKLQTELKENQS